MAITRDQFSNLCQSTGSSANSLVVTWNTNPAPGATVLVMVAQPSGTPTVSDNGAISTSFTRETGDNSNANNIWIFRANNIFLPASGAYEVIVQCGSSQNITAAAISYLGVKAGPPVSASSQGNSNNGPAATPSDGPYGPGALYFACFSDSLASGTDTIALTNANFTEQFTETNATLYVTGGVADLIGANTLASNGPQSCTWTVNSGVSAWEASIAVYEAAAPWQVAGGPLYAIGGTGTLPTPSISANNIGDIIAASVITRSQTVWATALSSSNATWSVAGSHFTETNMGFTQVNFIGVVTSTGSQTLTITLNGATPNNTLFDGLEFTPPGRPCVFDAQSGLDQASPGTLTFPLPSPAANAGAELYFCHGYVLTNTAVAGSTAGYGYYVDADSNGFCWHQDFVPGTAAPVWGGSTGSGDGFEAALAMLVAAPADLSPATEAVVHIALSDSRQWVLWH